MNDNGHIKIAGMNVQFLIIGNVVRRIVYGDVLIA